MHESLAALAALFALGTWGFLVALAAFVILLIIFAEEDGVKATVTLVLGAAFLQFVAKFDLLTLVTQRPFKLLSYAMLYVILGAVWSIVKWGFYVKAQRRTYDRLRKEYCRDKGITGDAFTDKQKLGWARHLASNYKANKRGGFRHYSSSEATVVIPDVTENKAAIIRWMTYWPFSVLFTLLNDPVRRLFEWVYENIGKTLQEMADRAFRGTENDLLSPERARQMGDGDDSDERSGRR